jgi:hypothetical protein
MNHAEYKIPVCIPATAWIERRNTCHAQDADSGQVSGDFLVQIVAAGAREKCRNGAWACSSSR